MQSLAELTKSLEEYKSKSTNQADAEMGKLRSKAEKKYRDTKKRLDIIVETSELFKEDLNIGELSAKDKYSNKIYETVEHTVNSIIKPEKFTLRNLDQFTQDARNALLQQDEILIKYVRLLKGSKYKKRVSSLSKALKKLNSELTKLERFISDDYAPNADIENTSQLIEDVLTKIKKYEQTFQEILEKETLVTDKDQEIEQLKKQLLSIQNHEVKQSYNDSIKNYTEFYKELDTKFANIRKAMRKYENIKSKVKDRPDLTLLKELIKDATNTLASQGNTSSLENLLSSILEELEETNLKLKKDKRDAAKEDIRTLLEGDLKKYWEEAKQIVNRKTELGQKLIELQLESEENKAKVALDAAKRDRNRIIERERRDLEIYENEILKELEEITDRIKSSIDPQVSFKMELLELPEWAELVE